LIDSMQPDTKWAEWRRGWTVVVAGTAGMALISVPTYTMGVMLGPIEQDLGWSRVEISFGLTLTSLASITMGSLFGMAADRIGRRPMGILSALLMCVAIALYSTVQSNITLWWAIWGLAGIAGAMSATVWAAAVMSRFTLSRGLALGLTLSGSGIAATFIPALGQSFIDGYGWRGAYLRLSGLCALIAVPLIVAFFREARDKRDPRSVRQALASAVQMGLTAREGFASASFYKLAAVGFLTTTASVGLSINLVPIMHSQGIGLKTAAVIAGILGLASVSGRIVGGIFVDRMKANLFAAGAALIGCSLAAMLLLFPGSTLAAGAGVVILGTSSGAQFGAMVYLAGRHFGTRSFGVLYGTINSLIGLAVGLGPVLANYVYDRTQSYNSVLWAIFPLLGCTAAIYLTLGRFPDFTGKDEPAEGKAKGQVLHQESAT